MTSGARIAGTLLAALMPLVASCSSERAAAPARPAASFAPPEQARLAQSATTAGIAKRYVAVRNFAVVEVEAAQVEAVATAARNRCAPPACEILESSVTREARGAPPNARIRVRIEPARADAFIDELARGGDLIERRVESEDKTDQVVDVEARIRNTTELRDRLRKLLAAPNATVKDLAEVESQLARVQSELDGYAGRRLALAQETEKVAVAVEIRPRRAIAESGVFTPVAEALVSIGHTFAQSLAVLIGFLVAIVPWVALLAALIWAWRRWRRRRRAAQP